LPNSFAFFLPVFTKIFIETPYRNQKMFAELVATLSPNTLVCIAADITLNSEFIKTLSVKEWKNQSIDLHKRPTIFIIHKE
jgi:16S rRNA (cytidine1402-2'-O)-methyltransferase